MLYFAAAAFFVKQFGQLPGVFITGESLLPIDEYTGDS
jgi:hypothetical protein